MKSKTLGLPRNQKRKQNSLQELPAIPDKRYFTIGEVGNLCGIKPHVLRYWEDEFPQLKPTKRRGNRRYYQHQDVLVVRQIRKLLYDDGFTIEGARSQLAVSRFDADKPIKTDAEVRKLITELEDILQELKSQNTSH